MSIVQGGAQPRSQGLSSLPPLVVGTETLVATGHVTVIFLSVVLDEFDEEVV